jgi:hypothetical protein
MQMIYKIWTRAWLLYWESHAEADLNMDFTNFVRILIRVRYAFYVLFTKHT